MKFPSRFSQKANVFKFCLVMKRKSAMKTALLKARQFVINYGKFIWISLICFFNRCTNCDRKVSIYYGFSFAKDCDYLFFRNFSMDLEKIRKKLGKNEKFTAYHCQCSWISTDKTVNITNDSQYKWVCGGGHWRKKHFLIKNQFCFKNKWIFAKFKWKCLFFRKKSFFFFKKTSNFF